MIKLFKTIGDYFKYINNFNLFKEYCSNNNIIKDLYELKNRKTAENTLSKWFNIKEGYDFSKRITLRKNIGNLSDIGTGSQFISNYILYSLSNVHPFYKLYTEVEANIFNDDSITLYIDSPIDINYVLDLLDTTVTNNDFNFEIKYDKLVLVNKWVNIELKITVIDDNLLSSIILFLNAFNYNLRLYSKLYLSNTTSQSRLIKMKSYLDEFYLDNYISTAIGILNGYANALGAYKEEIDIAVEYLSNDYMNQQHIMNITINSRGGIKNEYRDLYM